MVTSSGVLAETGIFFSVIFDSLSKWPTIIFYDNNNKYVNSLHYINSRILSEFTEVIYRHFKILTEPFNINPLDCYNVSVMATQSKYVGTLMYFSSMRRKRQTD
jgi:hypothetical protein